VNRPLIQYPCFVEWYAKNNRIIIHCCFAIRLDIRSSVVDHSSPEVLRQCNEQLQFTHLAESATCADHTRFFNCSTSPPHNSTCSPFADIFVAFSFSRLSGSIVQKYWWRTVPKIPLYWGPFTSFLRDQHPKQYSNRKEYNADR
jgi:hypothetical protein